MYMFRIDTLPTNNDTSYGACTFNVFGHSLREAWKKATAIEPAENIIRIYRVKRIVVPKEAE